ncbi:MAG: DUF2141 domain-containing protein [Bacteroidetes bacterium]|nr:DUF2141 domain-containing protein [Bacteroidota bacterium]
MKKNFISVLLFFVALIPGRLLANDSVTVHLSVEGFKNKDGICRVLVFNSEKGFPESHENAILILNEYITGEKVNLNFNILPGVYAISVLHDEDSDGKIDKTWYGKPKEGFGASNNPDFIFGPPDFEESAVKIDTDNKSLIINLEYF